MTPLLLANDTLSVTETAGLTVPDRPILFRSHAELIICAKSQQCISALISIFNRRFQSLLARRAVSRIYGAPTR
jgi:hypothetical protein